MVNAGSASLFLTANYSAYNVQTDASHTVMTKKNNVLWMLWKFINILKIQYSFTKKISPYDERKIIHKSYKLNIQLQPPNVSKIP